MKAPFTNVSRADTERLLRLKILVEIVQIDDQFRWPTVEVDLNAFSKARAVVSDNDMTWAISGDALFGVYTDGIVQPAHDEVNMNLAVFQNDTVTGCLRRIDHAREDGAALGAVWAYMGKK